MTTRFLNLITHNMCLFTQNSSIKNDSYPVVTGEADADIGNGITVEQRKSVSG